MGMQGALLYGGTYLRFGKDIFVSAKLAGFFLNGSSLFPSAV